MPVEVVCPTLNERSPYEVLYGYWDNVTSEVRRPSGVSSHRRAPGEFKGNLGRHVSTVVRQPDGHRRMSERAQDDLKM